MLGSIRRDPWFIVAAAREHSPGDARELVGECDSEQIAMRQALGSPLDPRPQGAHCRDGSPLEDDVGGLHKEGAQVLVAALGDFAELGAIGTGSGFKQGRDFAAWLGLVPKQESTGDRTKLGRISKRGNKYLRTLFVQAAHVVLERRPAAAMRALWPWIAQASKRLAHRNRLAIALANKLARIAWAVLARGRDYEPRITPNAP